MVMNKVNCSDLRDFRRIVISNDEIKGDHVTFSKRNSHYLRSVLRLKPGDVIIALRGNMTYFVKIEGWLKGCVLGRITQEVIIAEAGTSGIALAFSCVRPAPTEEIFRHGTELGVSSFFPIIAERSNRRPMFANERWQRVVESAISQCGRNVMPTIHDPLPLKDLPAVIQDCKTRFVLSAHAEPLTLILARQPPLTQRATILVGPEGGFTQAETKVVADAGFLGVSLGPYVLRAETAAIVAVGILSLWHTCIEEVQHD